MKEMINQQKEMFQKQNDMFQKHTEILMKHYNEIYENVSTLADQNQNQSSFNYADTYKIYHYMKIRYHL